MSITAGSAPPIPDCQHADRAGKAMSDTVTLDQVAVQEVRAIVSFSALLVEDNLADSELVLRELRRGGFEVT